MAIVQSIQFLRFVAASLVVFNHSVVIVNSMPLLSLGTPLLYLGRFGQAGVHVFFVISGFVMVYTTHHHFGAPGATWKFLRRRLTRIYPIYWLYALAALGAAVLWDAGAADAERALSALLLWPGSASALVFTGWSLSYEVFFYLCFALSLRLGLSHGLNLLTLAFGVLIALGLALEPSSASLHLATNTLLLEFIFGIWIGRAALGPSNASGMTALLVLLLALSGFGLGLWFGYERLPSVLAWGVPGALLVQASVMLEKAGRLPAWVQGLAPLGDSSYSLYLLHAILLPPLVSQLVRWRLLDQGSALAIMLALIPACILLAMAAHALLERPLQRWVRRLTSD